METDMTDHLNLQSYRLLGRSGLRISPLALGTMTFGADWGWGAEEAEARRIFDAYIDRGGNFVDTANAYTNGSSERLVGKFADGKRDRLVISTKYTMATHPGDPNSGGNHRKSMMRSVEESLRRLNSDYIDVLYLHQWDSLTPVEEILRGMDDLVRQGKVLYLGMSDTPAWQISRIQAIADLRGWSPFIALQSEYSLVERTPERDLIPMAKEMGLGVIPWSPLANGVLSGKYSRADLKSGDLTTLQGSRKDGAIGYGSLSARSLDIADVVKAVAAETGHSPAQIALAWTLLNPGVAATLLGARTPKQFEDNLGALDVHRQAARAAGAGQRGHARLPARHAAPAVHRPIHRRRRGIADAHMVTQTQPRGSPMNITLPEPIAAYFASDKLDAAAVARCFTNNAVVKDEGRTHIGLSAIKQWKAETSTKYIYTCEPFRIERSNGMTVVSCHLEGNFPGGQADLRFFFQLERGKIVNLEIIP
jgi:aryl-alcohol dehydrogenase-like predicted oxidoreductase